MHLIVELKLILKNADGLLLIMRKMPKKLSDSTAKWDFISGELTPGFPVLGNLQRIASEVAGVTLTYQPVVLSIQDALRIEERHTILITYFGIFDGEPRIKQGIEFKWAGLDELRALSDLDSYVRELIDSEIINEGLIEGMQ
jgi:hypothetical protein